MFLESTVAASGEVTNVLQGKFGALPFKSRNRRWRSGNGNAERGKSAGHYLSGRRQGESETPCNSRRKRLGWLIAG